MSQPKLSILVTGSNQGLGFSAARHLSKLADVHLFVCGRDTNRVREAAETLKREEGCAAEIDTVVMDITDDASIHAAVADLEKKLGGAALDVLVNNAAVALESDIARDGLRTRFENTFSVNAFGTAVAADAFLPLLKRSTAGPRIVNVGSSAGSCTQMAEMRAAAWMVYKASKSALNSIAISLAVENPDVHVVVVDPGLNATGMNPGTYGVGTDPSEGSQVIVDYALEIKGNSPGFYNAQGAVPW